MPSLWSRRAERKCSFVISELFSCDARSCAACNASCIFCVYLSMRIPENNQGAAVSKPPYTFSSSSADDPSGRRLRAHPLQVAFIPAMSDCDEYAGKIGWIEVARASAPGTVSPLYHRFAHFRQRHLDANDGAKLGNERAYEQGDPAGVG